jgi:hypothetical protein
MITREEVNDLFRRKGYNDPDALSEYERFTIGLDHLLSVKMPPKRSGGPRKKPNAPAKA